jgi:hypothetical protein
LGSADSSDVDEGLGSADSSDDPEADAFLSSEGKHGSSKVMTVNLSGKINVIQRADGRIDLPPDVAFTNGTTSRVYIAENNYEVVCHSYNDPRKKVSVETGNAVVKGKRRNVLLFHCEYVPPREVEWEFCLPIGEDSESVVWSSKPSASESFKETVAVLLPDSVNLPAKTRIAHSSNRWALCISKPTRGILDAIEPEEMASARTVVGNLQTFDRVALPIQQHEAPVHEANTNSLSSLSSALSVSSSSPPPSPQKRNRRKVEKKVAEKKPKANEKAKKAGKAAATKPQGHPVAGAKRKRVPEEERLKKEAKKAESREREAKRRRKEAKE